MKVLIGCPIYKRSWIFPLWASAIERQSVPLSDIGFIFEAAPDDEQTIAFIKRFADMNPQIAHCEITIREDIPHFEHSANSRQWTMSKYHNMVNLRNSLLKKAREISPDYYFSLDSDIIIKHPSTIELLAAHIDDGADAVSPLMFMTPFDTKFPSVMSWKDDGSDKAYRQESYPIGSYFKADVIMAAKMMSKKTYENVNYEFHSQGEDLGWCLDAKRKGLDLYSASYIYAPHLMHEEFLLKFLKEGDQRESILFENYIKT
jgi:hypothetical protein